MDGLGYASRFAAEQQDVVGHKAEVEIGKGCFGCEQDEAVAILGNPAMKRAG